MIDLETNTKHRRQRQGCTDTNRTAMQTYTNENRKAREKKVERWRKRENHGPKRHEKEKGENNADSHLQQVRVALIIQQDIKTKEVKGFVALSR